MTEKQFTWVDDRDYQKIEEQNVSTLDTFLKGKEFKYRVDIEPDSEEDNRKLRFWLEENSQNKWTVAFRPLNDSDCYYFQNKEDMLKCILVFGGEDIVEL